MAVKEEVITEELDEIDISDAFESKLIVYNDSHNPIFHVVLCFINILNHTREQAEQCTLIIHNKGKHIVKTGGKEDLRKYCSALIDEGLDARIE